jgi:MinD-like ATPase involved in chromosome partitioning or flagellar assembly
MSRGVRRAVGSSAADEVRRAADVEQIIDRPVPSCRQIAVTSIRGGAGKTTVAALLNLTYAYYRQDPVLVVEADAALGSLPVRLGAATVRWTCADLAQVVTPAMQFAELAGYLVQLPQGGWLLPAGQGRVGTAMDIAAYRTVTLALRRYFGVTVVDCETLRGELARTALDTVQARLLVAPATVAGVASARAVLEWMAAVPRPLLPGTVVALTAASPDAGVDLAAAARFLAETGVLVLTVPYDRHLAGGGEIRPSLLGQDTLAAAGRLAAELLDRAIRDGRGEQ